MIWPTFNRLGKRAKQIYLRRVLDRDGRVLEDHSSFYDPWTEVPDRVAAGYAKLYEVPEQVMAPETAFLMQSLMEQVAKPPGTGGRAAALGKPLASKVGQAGGWNAATGGRFACSAGTAGSTTPSSERARTWSGKRCAYHSPRNVPYEKPR